jgi:NitT/TauT family transport system permease protein
MTLQTSTESEARIESARPARSGAGLARKGREPVLSFLLLLALLGGWHWSTNYLGIPSFILPKPQEVFQWLVRGFSAGFSSPQSYWFHMWVTGREAFFGFVIGSTLGIVIGMALAHWSTAERVLYPYIVAFQSVPKIAIAPLLVVWFGFGIEAKIFTAAILTFFPLLVNSISGYHSVDPDRIDLARSCNASSAQIFWKIILPSSLPFIFAGLHMGVVLAFLGALVGEFVGATAGLGMLLLQYNNNMQVGGVFAILIVLGAIGFSLNLMMRWLENHFCFWARRATGFGKSGD